MQQEIRNEGRELDRSVHHQIFDYSEAELDTGSGTSSTDFRSEYFAKNREDLEKREEARPSRDPAPAIEPSNPESAPVRRPETPEEILKRVEGATGKLFDDVGRAWERGDLLGAAGRAALLTVPAAMVATGTVLQGAGVVVTLGSAGVAYLGHLGWDLSVANYGMIGVCAGIAGGMIGFGITGCADIFSQYVRERYGDTDR